MSRQRALVLASLPRFCPLCAGSKRVQLVKLRDMRGTGTVQCPHCCEHLPVLHLAWRADDIQPKGA